MRPTDEIEERRRLRRSTGDDVLGALVAEILAASSPVADDETLSEQDATEVVEAARDRLDEAIASAATAAAHASAAPQGARSYLFAVAKRQYRSVVRHARQGLEPAVAELERLLADDVALAGMGLRAVDVASAVGDEERQLAALIGLGLSTEQVRAARDLAWLPASQELVDRHLVEEAERTVDADLATLLCDSAITEVAHRAEWVVGRALTEDLERLAAAADRDPVTFQRDLLARLRELAQWTAHMRTAFGDEVEEDELELLSARAARARARAATTIGHELASHLASLYDDAVADLGSWAAVRGRLLAAATAWHETLAREVPGLDPVATALRAAQSTAERNGVRWAARSVELADRARSRCAQLAALARFLAVAGLGAWPLLTVLAHLDVATAAAAGALALGLWWVLQVVARELAAADAWRRLYRHPVPLPAPEPGPAGPAGPEHPAEASGNLDS
ncbi:MAG: hypothetical protein M5U14_10835 [Acidimicrobiia bacterium]|nr:hypothetical protein [Acidimicrobiia bacterium]